MGDLFSPFGSWGKELLGRKIIFTLFRARKMAKHYGGTERKLDRKSGDQEHRCQQIL